MFGLFKKRKEEPKTPAINDPSGYVSNIIFSLNGDVKELTISVTLFSREQVAVDTILLSFSERLPNAEIVENLNAVLEPLVNETHPTAKYAAFLVLSKNLNDAIKVAGVIEHVPLRWYLHPLVIMSADENFWYDLITETQGAVDRTILTDYQAMALLTGSQVEEL